MAQPWASLRAQRHVYGATLRESGTLHAVAGYQGSARCGRMQPRGRPPGRAHGSHGAAGNACPRPANRHALAPLATTSVRIGVCAPLGLLRTLQRFEQSHTIEKKRASLQLLIWPTVNTAGVSLHHGFFFSVIIYYFIVIVPHMNSYKTLGNRKGAHRQRC